MDGDDKVTVISPEGVVLDVFLAGVGSRFAAALLDACVQFTLMLAFLIVTAEAKLAAVGIVAAFVVLVGYPVAFEVLARGRTPGKRWVGLRVASTDGGAVRFRQSMVRNVLRIVDFLPAFYAVGVVTILVSEHNQRLGDLAGGTYVVRDAVVRKRKRKAPEPAVAMPPDAGRWDVSAITPEDLALARRFLDRRSSFLPEARAELAAELARNLRSKVAGAPSMIGPEQFIEEVVVAVKMARI